MKKLMMFTLTMTVPFMSYTGKGDKDGYNADFGKHAFEPASKNIAGALRDSSENISGSINRAADSIDGAVQTFEETKREFF